MDLKLHIGLRERLKTITNDKMEQLKQHTVTKVVLWSVSLSLMALSLRSLYFSPNTMCIGIGLPVDHK